MRKLFKGLSIILVLICLVLMAFKAWADEPEIIREGNECCQTKGTISKCGNCGLFEQEDGCDGPQCPPIPTKKCPPIDCSCFTCTSIGNQCLQHTDGKSFCVGVPNDAPTQLQFLLGGRTQSKIEISAITKPEVSFYDQEKGTTGKLVFKNGKFTFTGNASKSAKIFAKYLTTDFNFICKDKNGE